MEIESTSIPGDSCLGQDIVDTGFDSAEENEGVVFIMVD